MGVGGGKRMGSQFRALREWCRTCCTDHSVHAECPGPLFATAEERHGWRVLVITPFGPEIYGVLVARSRGLWRARIVTYPNILWILPDGGSIKFVAAGPGDAEHQAIEFVTRHCRQRGLQIEKKLPTVESGAVDPEHDPAIRDALAVGSAERKILGIPIRFGVGHVTQEATTDNISERGMFVHTDSPLPEGSSIHLHFDVEGLRMQLSGVVRWHRSDRVSGRPIGMGVEIHRPPPRYIHFVRQKLKTETDLVAIEEEPESDSSEPVIVETL